MVVTRSIVIQLLFIVVINGCDSKIKQEPPPSVFRTELPELPRTLLPYKLKDRYSQVVISKIFDNLFDYNEEFGIVPKLVKSWKIGNDSTSYTFNLKDNVYFHDGKKLTAKDAVFSLSKCFSEVNSMCSKITVFKELKVLSELSFQVSFNRPFIYFLDFLTTASMAIVPESFSGLSEEEFSKKPIGTASYKIGSVDDNQIVLIASSKDSKEKIETLIFSKTSDKGKLLSDLKAQIINEPNFALETLSREEKSNLESRMWSFTYPSFETSSIYYNLKVNQFNDFNMRKFLSVIFKSINYESVFEDKALRKSTGFLPFGMKGHVSDELLLRGLYSSESLSNIYQKISKVSLELIIPFHKEYTARFQAQINHLLKKYPKVKIRVKSVSKKEYYDQVLGKAYQMALVTWMGEFPIPYFYLTGFISNSNVNFLNLKDTKLDEMFDSVYGITRDEVNTAFSKIDQYICSNYYVVPLFYFRHTYWYPQSIKRTSISPSLLGLGSFRYEVTQK